MILWHPLRNGGPYHPSLVAGGQGTWGPIRTFSLKMKARMAAESSAKKMIRMNRKNCKEKGTGL